MKLITTSLGIMLLGLSMSAQAIPVTVEASGTGFYRDYTTNTYTYSANITQTWTFNTDDIPADIYGGAYSDLAQYRSYTDWINSTVSINGGTVVNESALVEASDSDLDYVYIEDNRNGYDRYQIYSTSIDYTGDSDHMISYAYFFDYIDDIIQGVDASQTFSWTDNDTSDFGYGYAYWYDWNGSSYDPRATLSYNLTSMSLTTSAVPEPGTLALLSLGLLGAGISRRRRAKM